MTDTAKAKGPRVQDFDPGEQDQVFLSDAGGIMIVPDDSFRDFEGRIHQPEPYRLAKWLQKLGQWGRTTPGI